MNQPSDKQVMIFAIFLLIHVGSYRLVLLLLDLLIPEELIRLKAHQIWEKRQLDGIGGNPQSDWEKAKQCLKDKKNRQKVFQWKFFRRITLWWEDTLVEDCLESIEFLLEKLAFFTILGRLGQLAFIVAVVSFVFGENVRRNNEVFSAWTTITTAHEQSGSGGRIRALEFLNSRPLRFPWIWVTIDLFGDEKECKRKLVFGRRWEREPLAGLSAPKAYLAQINLCGADLEKANFQDARLNGANLQDARLNGANLQNAKLWGINLQEADLSRANLQEAKLSSANLQNAELYKANLQNADLEEANLQNADLSRANLQEAKLSSANLQNAELYKANLQNAKLWGANLQNADLSRANLQNAKLWGVNLQKADLREANLQDAELREANFQDVRLYTFGSYVRANLQDADLREANLQGAILIKTENLTPKQIKLACFWDEAIYKGDPNEEKAWMAMKPDNMNYIEALKKDTTSDPKNPPDCNKWEKEN